MSDEYAGPWCIHHWNPNTCHQCADENATSAEVSRLTRALEEARAEVERLKEERDAWNLAWQHRNFDAAKADRKRDAALVEVSRLRGQVEGAWRAGAEAMREAAVKVVAEWGVRWDRGGNPHRAEACEVCACAIRALPPPSAPADDTDTNHKET